MNVWTRLFPFLEWPRPNARSLRKDATAGVTVGLVLIPQSVAYATLAGMPPVTGLYAALIPGVIGVLFGSSSVLALGPTALTSLLTFAALQPLAQPESAHWVTLAIWLALYAGLFQFLLGALRLGVIANFVSDAVITGFSNAAALIILGSQIPTLLGLSANGLAGQWAQFLAHVARPDGIWLWALVFGPGAFLLLLLQKRWLPRWPGVLVVCVLGIVASALIGFMPAGGDVVGPISGGLPALQAPASISLDEHRSLVVAAFIIALISFTETMASARTHPVPGGGLWDQSQELIGQGLAKIASGMSGAFPVSTSFSRSALNRFAGSTSGFSALFAGLCTLLCLLFFTGELQYLPRGILAAIIIVSVMNLLRPRAFVRLFRASLDDGLVGVATFVVTLVSVPYLHWGVLTGFVLAILFFLYRRANPRLAELGPHPDGTLRDRKLRHLAPIAPGVLALRLDASLTYITAPRLERVIRQRLIQDPEIAMVLICASAINAVDATGVEMMGRLLHDLQGRGVTLAFSGVKQQVLDVMERTGLLAEVDRSHLFASDREAMRVLQKKAGNGALSGDHSR